MSSGPWKVKFQSKGGAQWVHAETGAEVSNNDIITIQKAHKIETGEELGVQDACFQLAKKGQAKYLAKYGFDPAFTKPTEYIPTAGVPIPKSTTDSEPLPLDKPVPSSGAWVWAAPGQWFAITNKKVPNQALVGAEYAVHGNQTKPSVPPTELPGYQQPEPALEVNPFPKGWTTNYATNCYAVHKEGVSVPIKAIDQIQKGQGLTTLQAIEWWWNNVHVKGEPAPEAKETDELEFVDKDKLAKLNTWAWANTWYAVPPGTKPTSKFYGVTHVVVSPTMPTISPWGAKVIAPEEGKPHPWAGTHFGQTGVVYPDKSIFVRTSGGWWSLPKGKKVPASLSTAVGSTKITHVLVGAPKKPGVKPLTLEHAGVPSIPWPDSYRKWMTPRRAHDPLSFAVLFAQRASWYGVIEISEHLLKFIDQWIERHAHGDDDLDTECHGCAVEFDDEGRFLCPGCYQEFCLDCFDPMAGACHDCNTECSCGADGEDWHCEWCGTNGICEDCIHSVSWKGASYVCDECYSKYATVYGGKKGGIWAGDNSRERGTSNTPPWEERGIKIDPKALEKQIMKLQSDARPAWKEVWGFDDEDHDPVQVAADFYLLHPLQHNSLAPLGHIDTELRVLSETAGELRDGLIARYDDIFQRYVDMVIGGELRHHHCTRENLPGARHFAWCGWQHVREAVGADALVDAAKLFREMGGGSIGGENWAVICDVLHLRVTNRISPEVFIDRIFNIEHNGCTVLGAKVSWSGFFAKDYSIIKQYLGPAHAAHPARLDVLAQFASPDTARIWSEYVPALNRERRVYGMRPIRRLPTREEVGKKGVPRWRIVSNAATQRTVSVDDIRRLLTPDDIQEMYDSGECHSLNSRLYEKVKSGEVKHYDI